MTMGPEPMMRIFLMSSRRGTGLTQLRGWVFRLKRNVGPSSDLEAIECLLSDRLVVRAGTASKPSVRASIRQRKTPKR